MINEDNKIKSKSAYFDTVISVIARSVLSQNLKDAKEIDASLSIVTKSLVEKIELMPRVLRVPMKILTLLFDWSSFLLQRKFSRYCNHERVTQHSERWKKSSISAFRDYIKFFEKMTIFVYFSQKENQASGNHQHFQYGKRKNKV